MKWNNGFWNQLIIFFYSLYWLGKVCCVSVDVKLWRKKRYYAFDTHPSYTGTCHIHSQLNPFLYETLFIEWRISFSAIRLDLCVMVEKYLRPSFITGIVVPIPPPPCLNSFAASNNEDFFFKTDLLYGEYRSLHFFTACFFFICHLKLHAGFDESQEMFFPGLMLI